MTDASGSGHFTIIEHEPRIPKACLRSFLRRAESSYRRLRRVVEWDSPEYEVAVEVVEEADAASGSAEGIALPGRYILQTDRHSVFEHELVHVLAARAWGYGPPLLREGLAYHLTCSGAAWKAADELAWPATLGAYRGWRNAIVASAARDGQLPPLAHLLLLPYFWALTRFPKTPLDACAGVAAAASFTHYLLRRYPQPLYRRLYALSGPWDCRHIADEFSRHLGAGLDEITEDWRRFAARAGARSAQARAAYQHLRVRYGEVSRPAPNTNCWACGRWREAGESNCSCGELQQD